MFYSLFYSSENDFNVSYLSISEMPVRTLLYEYDLKRESLSFTFKKGDLRDYISSDTPLAIFSRKAKDLISKIDQNPKTLKWSIASAKSSSGEQIEVYIPICPILDALDKDKSSITRVDLTHINPSLGCVEIVTSPVIDPSKVGNEIMFNTDGYPGYFVSENLALALMDSDLTGFNLAKMRES